MMCSVANDLINKIIRLKTAILNTDLAVSTDCSFHNLMLNPNNILLKKRESLLAMFTLFYPIL